MSNNMTIKRQFENYRPNEYINAVKAGKDWNNEELGFVQIAEPGETIHGPYGEKITLPDTIFFAGPIIDRLAAYERTYMEPAEILDMRAEWACMKDEIESLKKEVEAWKKDAKKWENRYTNAKDKFIDENNELKKELKEAKQDTQKWIDNRQGLRVEYDKVLHELTAVKDELAEARNIIKNREAEIVVLDDLVESKDKEIEELKGQIKNKDVISASGDMTNEFLNNYRKHLEEKIDELTKEIDDCRRVNKELREMYTDKSGECDDLRKDNAILKHNLDSKGWDRLSKIIEQLEQELESKNSAIASLEKYIEDQKHIKKIQAQVLNSIYGSPFRGGAIYPKFPVDINDLIAKLREYKDIMVSVSQYDDSVTVNVTPWTPPVEEKETSFQEDLDFFVNECTKAQLRELYNQVSKKLNMITIEESKWSEVTEVMRELRMRLDDNNLHCFMAYCASEDEVDINISRKKKK